MTNEEKANEIGTTIWEEWKDATLATGAEKGAILMAEWKDEQFKEFLKKKIEKYDSANCLVYAEHIYTCQTIIKELFGETKTNTDREE